VCEGRLGHVEANDVDLDGKEGNGADAEPEQCVFLF
jgi:hypothetical protein